MIIAVRHTGMVVRDIDRAVAFYEGMGFRTWRRVVEDGDFIDRVIGLDGVRVETAKLTAPCGALLELLQYHSHPDRAPVQTQPSNRLGFSHLSLTVASIDKVLDYVQAQGGARVNPPIASPDGTVRVAYCHDPEGNLLELVEQL